MCTLKLEACVTCKNSLSAFALNFVGIVIKKISLLLSANKRNCGDEKKKKRMTSTTISCDCSPVLWDETLSPV